MPQYGQAGGLLQQSSGAPISQPPSAPVPNSAAKNKQKKKKNIASTSSQSVPPPQMPFVQPQFPFLPGSYGGLVNAAGAPPVVQSQADSFVQAAGVSEATELVSTKSGKCWKCSVDTHATKDCKVQHYCLVCDTISHPTLRCPTLKLPKLQAFVGGPACEESLCLRLPDSVYRAHLAPKGRLLLLLRSLGGLLLLWPFRT
jgi:hypothetical protein